MKEALASSLDSEKYGKNRSWLEWIIYPAALVVTNVKYLGRVHTPTAKEFNEEREQRVEDARAGRLSIFHPYMTQVLQAVDFNGEQTFAVHDVNWRFQSIFVPKSKRKIQLHLSTLGPTNNGLVATKPIRLLLADKIKLKERL